MTSTGRASQNTRITAKGCGRLLVPFDAPRRCMCRTSHQIAAVTLKARGADRRDSMLITRSSIHVGNYRRTLALGAAAFLNYARPIGFSATKNLYFCLSFVKTSGISTPLFS
jgi:hypothetical protein